MSDQDQPKRPLSYELPPASPVSRRQFRLLTALVVINLLITLQFAYFPNLTAAVKNRWAQYQQKREREAAVRQALALEQEAMRFSDPAGKVVWDEDPETAAKLLAGQGYRNIEVEGLDGIPQLSNWPRGAWATPPPVVTKLWSPADRFPVGYAPVFMHGLKSASGLERLVYVFVEGRLNLHQSNARGRPGATPPPGTYNVRKELRLHAWTWVPGAGEKPPQHQRSERTQLLIHENEGEGLLLNWHWTPPAGDQPERILLEGREMFRFFAGQPDPADPSRFTADYDVDGRRGTIRGQLKNDGTVELRPSTGTLVGSRWYPASPSTQPTGR
jgi:hypothetical protein